MTLWGLLSCSEEAPPLLPHWFTPLLAFPSPNKRTADLFNRGQFNLILFGSFMLEKIEGVSMYEDHREPCTKEKKGDTLGALLPRPQNHKPQQWNQPLAFLQLPQTWVRSQET